MGLDGIQTIHIQLCYYCIKRPFLGYIFIFPNLYFAYNKIIFYMIKFNFLGKAQMIPFYLNNTIMEAR